MTSAYTLHNPDKNVTWQCIAGLEKRAHLRQGAQCQQIH